MCADLRGLCWRCVPRTLGVGLGEPAPSGQRARAEGGDGASLNDALLERKFLQQQRQLQEQREPRGRGAFDRDEVVSSPIGAMLLRRKMLR